MDKDLKWIKKHYGEEMMHMCREMFPKILEKEGFLPDILDKNFSHYRHLAEDIKSQNQQDEFKNYIFSLIDIEKKEIDIKTIKSAVELLDEAGYILYPECETEDDIQSFKKYYQKDECLCTFIGGRLNTCRVWFAVKKDVNKIKRKNFPTPKRQDEYGTSVISIQFSRHGSTLSIKNRYNHTVNNPDNTFNSDLDNIIPGLTDAFEKDFGVRDYQDKKVNFDLINYVRIRDKFYHYNHEINNIYYCDNNVIIDHFKLNRLPESQMLIDYFILNFKNKTISTYDGRIEDSFIDSLGKIETIDHRNGVISLTKQDNTSVIIGINDRRQIISLTDENLQECKDNYLYRNRALKELNLPALQKCENDFLYSNRELEELNLPVLQRCGGSFLDRNKKLQKINLPALKKCEYGFLHSNKNLTELSLPSLEMCDDWFLYYNEDLQKLDLPSLKFCGKCFLYNNKKLQKLNLPSLIFCKDSFMYYNKELNELTSPLETCGDLFLYYNENLQKLNLPKLRVCGDDFLHENKGLQKLNLSSLRKCGDYFLYKNENLSELNLPNLIECQKYFLYYNDAIQKLNLPALQKCGNKFLQNTTKLKEIDLPSLQECGSYFLSKNTNLKEINLPALQKCGKGFFPNYKINLNPMDFTIC